MSWPEWQRVDSSCACGTLFAAPKLSPISPRACCGTPREPHPAPFLSHLLVKIAALQTSIRPEVLPAWKRMIMNAFPRGVAGELKTGGSPQASCPPSLPLRSPRPAVLMTSLRRPRWSPYSLPPLLSGRRPLFHTPARAESPKLANLGNSRGSRGL